MQCISVEHPYLGQFSRSFVLKTEAGDVLIDSGLKSGLTMLTRYVDRPLAVLCTHGHWDHTAGHGAFQKLGAKVYAANGDSAFINDTALQWTLLYGRFEAEFDIPASRRTVFAEEADGNFSVDVLLSDNDILTFGSVGLRVLSVPGHSDGSICLLEPESGRLFTGDTVCGNGFFGVLPQISDIPSYECSLQRLAKIDVSAALTAHWESELDNQAFHRLISDGLDCCERLRAQTRRFLCGHRTVALGQFADFLCESEGNKPKNSGACVTALALLEEFSSEYENVAQCAEIYSIRR